MPTPISHTSIRQQAIQQAAVALQGQLAHQRVTLNRQPPELDQSTLAFTNPLRTALALASGGTLASTSIEPGSGMIAFTISGLPSNWVDYHEQGRIMASTAHVEDHYRYLLNVYIRPAAHQRDRRRQRGKFISGESL